MDGTRRSLLRHSRFFWSCPRILRSFSGQRRPYRAGGSGDLLPTSGPALSIGAQAIHPAFLLRSLLADHGQGRAGERIFGRK